MGKEINDFLNTLTNFSDRERRLIKNSIVYSESDPAGVPGHNLMVIIAKLVEELRKS